MEGNYSQINTIKHCSHKLLLIDLKTSVGILLLLLIVSLISNLEMTFAITQFYFSIPDVIQDLDGITFSVETSDDDNYDSWSWNHNGSYFVPQNNTHFASPIKTNLHLDDNDFLVAVVENTDVGTRTYGCISLPYPNEQFDCQWDAIDKDNTAYYEFDFYFQSHKDSK